MTRSKLVAVIVSAVQNSNPRAVANPRRINYMRVPRVRGREGGREITSTGQIFNFSIGISISHAKMHRDPRERPDRTTDSLPSRACPFEFTVIRIAAARKSLQTWGDSWGNWKSRRSVIRPQPSTHILMTRGRKGTVRPASRNESIVRARTAPFLFFFSLSLSHSSPAIFTFGKSERSQIPRRRLIGREFPVLAIEFHIFRVSRSTPNRTEFRRAVPVGPPPPRVFYR